MLITLAYFCYNLFSNQDRHSRHTAVKFNKCLESTLYVSTKVFCELDLRFLFIEHPSSSYIAIERKT